MELAGEATLPAWVYVFVTALWVWFCYQTYRGVKFARVRAQFGDLGGRFNPFFWIFFLIYAFGALFLPVFLLATLLVWRT